MKTAPWCPVCAGNHDGTECWSTPDLPRGELDDDQAVTDRLMGMAGA